MKHNLRYVIFLISIYIISTILGSYLFSYRSRKIDQKNSVVSEYNNIKSKEAKFMDEAYEEEPNDEKDIILENDKIAYLTFDDGPSSNITPKILDILEENHINATFFITGERAKSNKEIIKDIRLKKHSIGNHSYTHDFNIVYSSKENFTNEVESTERVLKDILGEDYKSDFFRFPGGSFEDYKDAYKDILKNMNIKYIDWNALNGDSEYNNVPVEAQLQKIKETVSNKDRVIILLHDSSSKETTVEALPEIIKYLKEENFKFIGL
ncbi:polysaccharide deacetylase [Clostridium algidicarnis]|uniref:polysaccharide deacetylase family protein n=1 Tax=Clostridium algidicarnis TaxID=37659 RepID=UPI001629906C|nr:polysaccharide deacetylase family protein [Clostridium algidicarnis]MBB6630968.1 polysaccharide deacetylase [Clostridium algidicarnis]MBB6698038.1 polysaccharide deacetylase [Clostridium algidicarnis]MBU3203724.1 polysaccharide deacetylase [Clostridium algidicarnis]MBU3211878.1 polysaccharide deacetylase [Clostridium algidicarnis]MBU3221616.1 polysaccharide deacetylase [Clostridium algidicarnis]